MIKTHFLFDFDGTLVDSAPAILSCFEQVLQAHGLAPQCPINDTLIGPPLRQALTTVSGQQDSDMLDALSASFKEIYDDQACLQTAAYPQCTAVLEGLRAAGFQLAIATNKRLYPTRRILSELGWETLFCQVFASDSYPQRYGDKRGMIAALLHDLGIPAEAAVYVGDTLQDGSAAAANAVEFWPVQWGYGHFGPASDALPSMQALLCRASSLHSEA